MDAWVVVATAAAALTIALLGSRLPMPVWVLLTAAASGALGWAVIGLRPDPAGAEVVLAVLGMAVLGPFHARVVLGPPR